ncbi:MAG: hypothetical protein IKQ71_07955 [Lachnospiraceae bacterium]|nr:hypothetical protein [Lachnospiraceae bacterium]
MINKLYNKLAEKYENVNERVCISNRHTGVKVKTLSKEAESIVDELLVLSDVFGKENYEDCKDKFEIIVDIDEKLSGELRNYMTHNLTKSEKEVFNRRMPSPGIDVYEVDGEYALVDWRKKALMITRIGSNKLIVLADTVTGELHGLIKHLGTTPFVLSGDIHLIHGTSVNYRGKNIIVAAESGHGKTTFGLLFGFDGGALISEDITYIVNSSQIINTGSKNYITIRKGTLYAFREYFSEFCTEENVSPKELYLAREDESVRVALDTIKLHSESGKKLESIDCVIVPEIDGDYSGYEIVDLSKDEIDSINTISNRDYNTDWLIPLLSCDAESEECRNNCQIEDVRYVRLHTDFNYRDYFEEIINDLIG